MLLFSTCNRLSILHRNKKNRTSSTKSVEKLSWRLMKIWIKKFVVLFYIFSNNLEDLYNLSSVARIYYNDGLIYYLIGFLLTALTKPVCSYLYSVGDRLRSNLLTILEPLILTPLFYLILCPGLKLNGLWMTYLFAQIGVLIASTFFIIRNIRREKLWTDL